MINLKEIKRLENCIVQGLTSVRLAVKFIDSLTEADVGSNLGQVKNLSQQIKQDLADLNPMIFHRLASLSLYKTLFCDRLFTNDPRKDTISIIHRAEEHFNSSLRSLKKSDAIRKKQIEKREIILFLRHNLDLIIRVVDVQNKFKAVTELYLNDDSYK